MSKTFRPWKIEEPLLLPVTVADFVAESHLARFVLSVVRDEVDLGKITGTYGSELGQPPFNPIMMTALLLYAYCSGIYSSRQCGAGCVRAPLDAFSDFSVAFRCQVRREPVPVVNRRDPRATRSAPMRRVAGCAGGAC